jgi:hypothetical protein
MTMRSTWHSGVAVPENNTSWCSWQGIKHWLQEAWCCSLNWSRSWMEVLAQLSMPALSACGLPSLYVAPQKKSNSYILKEGQIDRSCCIHQMRNIGLCTTTLDWRDWYSSIHFKQTHKIWNVACSAVAPESTKSRPSCNNGNKLQNNVHP